MLLTSFQFMVVAYDDWFIPESAPLVIAAIRDCDDETCGLTITVIACCAEADSMRN